MRHRPVREEGWRGQCDVEVRCDVKMASSLERMCSRDSVAVSALALCGVCRLITTKVEVCLGGNAFAGTIVTSIALLLMKFLSGGKS